MFLSWFRFPHKSQQVTAVEARCPLLRFWPVPHGFHLVYKIKPIFFFSLPDDLISPGASVALHPKPEQRFLSTLRM